MSKYTLHPELIKSAIETHSFAQGFIALAQEEDYLSKEDFLEKIYNIPQKEGIRLIMNTFPYFYQKGLFDLANEIVSELDVDKLDIAVSHCILIVMNWTKRSNFPIYTTFLENQFKILKNKYPEDSDDRIWNFHLRGFK